MMPNESSPPSTIFGNCINCDGIVRVPVKSNPNASVRCPHCETVFKLSELLDRSAPELEFVDASPPQSSDVDSSKQQAELYIDKSLHSNVDESGKFVVPPQLSKGARRRNRRSSKSSSKRNRQNSSDRSKDSFSGPSAIDKPTSVATATESSPAVQNAAESTRSANRATRTTSTPQRPRAASPHRSESQYRTRNPIFDILRVALGVCFALPLAYLIVIWVFSLDPLGVGRVMGRSMPALVPAQFRSTGQESPKKSTSAPQPDIESVETEINTLRRTPLLAPDGSVNSLNLGDEAINGLAQ